MFVSHIIGTAILLFNVISTNAQFGNRAQGGNFPRGQGTGGGRQLRFGQRGGGRFQVPPPGFGLPNVPPPPGFQQISRQIQNALPRNLQNALPRNPAAGGAGGGVNSVLNAGGFTGRFGAARGSELTRQLSPAPPGTFGGFSGAAGGVPNLPGANRVQQRIPPNFAANQIRQRMGFGQQVPGAVPLQTGRGPRNQPQAVMPRQIGNVNLNNLQPGQAIGAAMQPQTPNFNFPPQNVQTQNSARFQSQRPPQTSFAAAQQNFAVAGQQSFPGQPQPFAGQQQQQQTFAGAQQQQQAIPQQMFGAQPSFGAQQPFGAQAQQPQPFGAQAQQPQPFGAQAQQPQQFGAQAQQPQPFGPPQPSGNEFAQAQPIGMMQQGLGGQASFAFQQPITQPIGFGRPSSQISLPPGAPKLLPGEVEIAPPISPAAAAAITSGGTGGAPPSVSEIITISDINGNVLYRGVDLSDSEIEKITTQLVNNMSDSQAADAAQRGRELEAQGKLDSAIAAPSPLPTNMIQGQTPAGQQMAGQQQQQQQQGQQGFGGGGQGFSSWGQQQGLRFPGQEPVVGDSRTVLNLIAPTNTDQSG